MEVEEEEKEIGEKEEKLKEGNEMKLSACNDVKQERWSTGPQEGECIPTLASIVVGLFRRRRGATTNCNLQGEVAITRTPEQTSSPNEFHVDAGYHAGVVSNVVPDNNRHLHRPPAVCGCCRALDQG